MKFYTSSFFLIILSQLLCGQRFKITNSESLSNKKYLEYNNLLNEASNENNLFNIGIQLANLNQTVDSVYKYLNLGVEQNKANCLFLMQNDDAYKKDNFQLTILSIDSLKWRKLCNRCLDEFKMKEPYDEYKLRRIQKYEAFKQKLNLDTTKYDKKLIKFLDSIDYYDQLFRKYYDVRKQDYFDSINLVKIINFIDQNTYPDFRSVGMDRQNTIFFVLHHQANLEIREKYTPYLELASRREFIANSMLQSFKERTAEIYHNNFDKEYPDLKVEKLSTAIYNKYSNSFQKAISENDSFNIGIQLANLEQNSEIVYSFIKKGIKQNKLKCIEILDHDKRFREYNFKIKLINLDSLRWRSVCESCIKEYKMESAFKEYLLKQQLDYDTKIKNLDIDSTLFDYKLIALLDSLNRDDQKYRKGSYNQILQDSLDSINIKRILPYISSNPYPSVRLVGLKHDATIFILLHHQSNVEIREKFTPYFQEAVKKGLLSQGFLDHYKERTQNFKDDKYISPRN